MNRTNIAIVVLAAAVLIAVGSAQTNRGQVATGPVGRYQIVAGEHMQTGSSEPAKDVFRIDTVTGLTVVYIYGTSPDGKFSDRWSPIAEK